MANPFLVLGGIAVGIVTAGFGILQVPGWIGSAQDASAQNDLAQVSIGQAAALSVNGAAKTSVAGLNADTKVGVQVSTSNQGMLQTSGDGKHYGVIVVSESGNVFARIDGGEVYQAKKEGDESVYQTIMRLDETGFYDAGDVLRDPGTSFTVFGGFELPDMG
jgi:acid stress-induced BolA-like protein IbaG/YrbA